MRRWFLSYNLHDLGLAEGFEAGLRRKDPQAQVYFALRSMAAGGFWAPELAKVIADATAFVLLVGERGIAEWQVLEYYEALERRLEQGNFPIVLVLVEGQSAPGLPFLHQLHWIVTTDPLSEDTLGRLISATAGAATRPGDLWRYTAPYRGLSAMTEVDADFFFGREQETVETLRTLAATPDKLPILLGNSGVGKSSLAQAGVLAALKRQGWPETWNSVGEWPQVFRGSRQWAFLTLRPGAQPLNALIDSFLRTWQHDTTDPTWEERRATWVDRLIAGSATLSGLLDATERRRDELGRPSLQLFSCVSTRVKSFTCDPRSVSDAVSRRSSRMAFAIPGCAH
jgi:hypothetical protein